jgi:hypothetical protein
MLLVLFVFKASSFGLMGLGLDFALLWPYGGHHVFSAFIWWLVGVLLHPHGGRHVMICVFLVHVLTQFLVKIILSYFGYQFNCCKFYVGLTSFTTRIEASIPSLISLCFNLFSFW